MSATIHTGRAREPLPTYSNMMYHVVDFLVVTNTLLNLAEQRNQHRYIVYDSIPLYLRLQRIAISENRRDMQSKSSFAGKLWYVRRRVQAEMCSLTADKTCLAFKLRISACTLRRTYHNLPAKDDFDFIYLFFFLIIKYFYCIAHTVYLSDRLY